MKKKTIALALLCIGSMTGTYALSDGNSTICVNAQVDSSFMRAKELFERGDYLAAFEGINRTIELYQQSRSDITPEYIDYLILKGRLLGFLKHYGEAVNQLLSAFDQHTTIPGISEVTTTQLYKHIGWHLERFTAKNEGRDPVQISETSLSHFREHLSSIKPLQFDIQTGDLLLLAQECYEIALSKDSARFGERHAETAKSHGLTGWILGVRQHYLEAIEQHQKALAIRVSLYSESHPDVARSYGNIGWNYEQLQNYECAFAYYAASLKIREEILSPSHPEIAECLESINRIKAANPPKN